MNLQIARSLVREYFTIETDEQADQILRAALRSDKIDFRFRDSEKSIRAALASTRELFGHVFKVS